MGNEEETQRLKTEIIIVKNNLDCARTLHMNDKSTKKEEEIYYQMVNRYDETVRKYHQELRINRAQSRII